MEIINLPQNIQFIFYHIEKCGGTSVRYWCFNYFSKLYSHSLFFMPEMYLDFDSNISSVYYIDPNINFDYIYFKDIINICDYNDLKVILSHIRYYIFPFPQVPLKFTIIRNPIERLISHYYFFDYTIYGKDLCDLDSSDFHDYCYRFGSYMCNLFDLLDDNQLFCPIKCLKRLQEFIMIAILENINADMIKLNQK